MIAEAIHMGRNRYRGLARYLSSLGESRFPVQQYHMLSE
jgi:hypothetical protein